MPEGGDAALTPPPTGCKNIPINEGETPPTPKGLIQMAGIYGTTELATEIMGEEVVADNRKAATRTLRKFLRDELGEGKSVVGKGGRYALELKAAELRNLKKKFAAWEVAQEEAKEARAAALAAAKAPKVAETAPEEPETADEALEDDEAGEAEGPTDEEIAAMLEDDTEELDEI